MGKSRDDPITVVLYDTKTKKFATDSRRNSWWWAEGNGSCDCNRDINFEFDNDDDFLPESHECYGIVERFLIIGADILFYSLYDLNKGFPRKLLDEYLKEITDKVKEENNGK